MDTQLERDIREFKKRESYLQSLQKEYNKQTGLSFAGSNTPVQSINLPLHPATLQKELGDYKEYAESLEEALVQLEANEKFLRLILQEPLQEKTLDERAAAEEKAVDLEQQIRANQDKVDNLRNTIELKTDRLETLHSRISIDADKLTRIMGDIENITKPLEQVKSQLDQQTGLPLKEIVRIEEQLMDESVQLNMDIDERRGCISRLRKEVTKNQSTVDKLESQLESLKQKTSRQQVHSEQYAQRLENAIQTHQSKTKKYNRMVDVDDFITIPGGFTVRFANKAELDIIIKDDKIENAVVTSRNCPIQDLVLVAKSYPSLDQGINTIIYGALARLTCNV